MESVAGIKWNGWPEWSGITGRDHLEYSSRDYEMIEGPFFRLFLCVIPVSYWTALHEYYGMVTVLPDRGCG